MAERAHAKAKGKRASTRTTALGADPPPARLIARRRNYFDDLGTPAPSLLLHRRCATLLSARCRRGVCSQLIWLH